MITTTLEASRCIVTGSRFAELRHDVTLVDWFGFVCHGVDVLAWFFAT